MADDAASAAERPPADGASAEDVEFFRSEVFPILKARCFKCHGGEAEIRGELRLTHREGVVEGGELGPAVDLESPSDSMLLEAINYDGLEMPPRGKLPEAEIAVLTRWVERGVPFDPDLESEEPEENESKPAHVVDDEARNHWAYRRLERPALPAVDDTQWVRTPIDRFVLARLEDAGFQPAPVADRVSLIRRAYFDLLGLPPTPEDVAMFVADDAPDAYERLIDRLLASPHYGEKWGRHWLDLVRYAETNGYERDGTKANAWRFRDYVIRSFNADMSYDQFVREQLAGDELEQVTHDSLIATGFYRLGIWDDEPVDADQAYYDSLDDVVVTSSQVFLAMTVGCARCHDHKIDPIPQRDYYRFMGFFHNTLRDIRQLEFEKSAFTLNTQQVIADIDEIAYHQQQKKKHESEIASLEQVIAGYEKDIEATFSPPEKEDAADKKTREALLRKKRKDALSAESLADYLATKQALAELRKHKLPPLPHALVIRENGPTAPETYVLIRGNAHAPGEEVEPGFPDVLGFDSPTIPTPPASAKSSGQRTALAEWIVSPENSLPARVIVNRVWQHHFGRGIARTTSDFGRFGELPTHPQLLDWLATEFRDGGWRMKALHRLMMLSSTYRMGTQGDPRAHEQDPTNDLLARFDLRRLTAEEVRDSVLATSGRLTRVFGGASVYSVIPEALLAGASRPDLAWGNSPPEDQTRRSVYVHVKRSVVEPVLATFDLADTDASCAVRFTSTVPTQALTMLNSDFFTSEASAFADRVRREVGSEPHEIAHRCLQLALGRTPTADEVDRGAELISAWQDEDGLTLEQATSYFALMVINLNEFIYLD